MPQRPVTAIRLFILPLFFAILPPRPACAESKDVEILKQHYIEYLLAGVPDAAQVRQSMQSLKPDGTWPDIDYHNRTRSGWPMARHLDRIERMAKAYRQPGGADHGNPQLKAAILLALQHWLDKDYTNPNWWWNKIGVPKRMADIFVLMGDAVPEAMVRRAMTTSLARARIGMTGQNKVWLAGIVFVRCLIDGNKPQLDKARKVILSELRLTTAEGVQPDWSFHQHGPQQQFGNYGSAFGDSITQWAVVFRGTAYALNDRQLSILRHYLLQGPSWILWQGNMDLSGCGRQLHPHCQATKGRAIVRQLARMIQIDPANAEPFRARLKANQPDAVNTLIGNKQYWRSDMMVHRRPRWYASVKMSSKRVVGAETCNSENLRGLHLGDGAMYVYQTGREYENIQPLWDWHRLPGTTCDQSIADLVPSGKKCRLPTSFVGGVTDGQRGVAALDYQRRSLAARKAWFFLDDAIVCLGAGIHADDSGPVFTSIQQSLGQSPVTTSSGPVSQGIHPLHPGNWVHHANIGYLILTGDKPIVQLAPQQGDWHQLFGNRASSPQAGDVFSLWIDHGRSPDNQAYAYAVFPQTSPDQMSRLAAKPGFQILSNTPDLQAVVVDGDVQAVFYAAGKLEWAAGRSLRASRPCMVIVKDSPTASRLYVCDPTQQQPSLQLTLDGHTRTVQLPTAGQAGATVELDWN